MILLKQLSEPFPAKDIEWRVQSAGEKNGKVWAIVLAYVTNRAIMERLDDICGPDNWKNEYKEWIGGSVLCGISIKIGEEWITKWDGAEQTDIEAVKGGLSGAMKRAAVQWGIGRYLYNLEATMAVISDKGQYYQSGKKDKYPPFKWNPPSLPQWALPAGEKPQQQKQPESQPELPAEAPEKPKVDSEDRKLIEGEVLNSGHWFWKIPADQRQQYIPAGCKYGKVGTSWTIIKAA